MTEQNVRELVLDTLLSIEKEGVPSHIRIREVLDRHGNLTGSERAFYKRLTEGVLEERIRLDYIIDLYAKLKTSKMKPLIRNVLRMAVYQIMWMDSVPDSAAVNEAVKLVSRHGYGSLRGFVNGILRNIIRHPERIRYPEKEKTSEYLSVYYSVPEWLVQRWLDQFGKDLTETICKSFSEPRPLSVRIRSGNIRKKLEADGIDMQPGFYLPHAAVLTGAADLKNVKAFADGDFTVQDESSQIAVLAAGIRPGDLVADLCAAPGGKSVYAADLLKGSHEAGGTEKDLRGHQHGRVIARDLTEYKTNLIRENISRCHLEEVICTEVRDASVFDADLEGKADIVIADLPCSGMGVIGRKPDIRYGLSEESIQDLVKLQRSILKNAARYLKKGGRLLYSTCTIEPSENIENAKWIRSELGLQPLSLADVIPDAVAEDSKTAGLPDTRADGYLQMYPGVHKCDGFFVSVFTR